MSFPIRSAAKRIAVALTLTMAAIQTAPASETRDSLTGLYFGEVLCAETDRFVHLSFEADGAVLTERPRDVDIVTDRTPGRLDWQGENFKFTDLGGSARLTGTALGDGTELQAVWLDPDGAPDSSCEPLVLQQQKLPPPAQLDTLRSLLATPEPDLPQAEQVAVQFLSLNALEFLPEAERQTVLDELAGKRQSFWERFWVREAARQDAMPANTAHDIRALSARMADVSRDAMAPGDSVATLPSVWTGLPGKESGDFQLWMATRLADRSQAIGVKPAPLAFGRDRRTCLRLHAGGNVTDLAGLAMRFRLPVDYWDEASLSIMRDDLAQCARLAGAAFAETYAGMVRLLNDSGREIERRVAVRLWLESEVARLLALPRTIETLRATNSYTLPADELNARQISSDDLRRFVGKRLDAARQEATLAAQSTVAQVFAAATLNSPVEEQALALCRDLRTIAGFDEICHAETARYLDRVVAEHVQQSLAAIQVAPRDLSGLRAAQGYLLPPLRSERFDAEIRKRLTASEAAFEAVAAPWRAQAVSAARAEIEAAFAQALPGTEAENSAKALCATDPGKPANPVLTSLCGDVLGDYAGRRDDELCDNAVAAAAAQPDLLDSRIAWQGMGAAKPVIVRDLICQFALMKVAARFEDKPGMLSDGLRLLLRPAAGTGAGNRVVIDMTAASDTKGRVWQPNALAVEDASGGSRPLAPENLLTCLASNAC